MKRIVQDQKITDVKVRLARDFRKGMTEVERAFWCLVRNRKLCNLKFRRQQIIDGFIVDFFCNEAGLVIEIDGPIHKEKEQMVIDKERGEIFKRRGLKELRFSNGEVLNDPEAVRETIKQVVSTPPSLIEERGAGG